MTNAERQKRYRDRKRNATVTIEPGSVTVETLAKVDAACGDKLSHGLPTIAYAGGPDCKCGMCRNWRAKGKDTAKLNHGPEMICDELPRDWANRVPLPGDVDYVGVAV